MRTRLKNIDSNINELQNDAAVSVTATRDRSNNPGCFPHEVSANNFSGQKKMSIPQGGGPGETFVENCNTSLPSKFPENTTLQIEHMALYGSEGVRW
jgi:hypothetical protein